MGRDLTVSEIDRQNILNNDYALHEIQKATKISGIFFEGKQIVTKEQVASFFEVSPRTIENYIAKYEQELLNNGYEVVSGNRLKLLKKIIKDNDVAETIFGNIDKAPALSIFDFRAFLNISMIITDNERARLIRQLILDIAIDVINQRTGGGTKYINQRDEDFLSTYFAEENYRQKFTNALNECVDMGKFKYPLYTDKIYLSIFKEKAQEYRKILKLEKRDKVRDTLYAEVLDIISAYEFGFADIIIEEYNKKGRKLKQYEVDLLFKNFESQALWKPLIEKARNKMASRDLAFRDALHMQLQEYITPIQKDDFERFIGEKSKELLERINEAKDVMERLKNRE